MQIDLPSWTVLTGGRKLSRGQDVARRTRTREHKLADPMTLMNLLAGKWGSQAVAVAAEFQVADLLRDGSKTAAELAQAPAWSPVAHFGGYQSESHR